MPEPAADRVGAFAGAVMDAVHRFERGSCGLSDVGRAAVTAFSELHLEDYYHVTADECSAGNADADADSDAFRDRHQFSIRVSG